MEATSKAWLLPTRWRRFGYHSTIWERSSSHSPRSFSTRRSIAACLHRLLPLTLPSTITAKEWTSPLPHTFLSLGTSPILCRPTFRAARCIIRPSSESYGLSSGRDYLLIQQSSLALISARATVTAVDVLSMVWSFNPAEVHSMTLALSYQQVTSTSCAKLSICVLYNSSSRSD